LTAIAVLDKSDRRLTLGGIALQSKADSILPIGTGCIELNEIVSNESLLQYTDKDLNFFLAREQLLCTPVDTARLPLDTKTAPLRPAAIECLA
jgi:hypothetical protein